MVCKLSLAKTKHEHHLSFHLQGKNGNSDEIRMFNCDHCQKKYKRQWHQARHNQMKHENSNTSTATSSTSTPPTPEINGNLNLPSANNLNNNTIVNNNFNYQQNQSQIPPHQLHPSPPAQAPPSSQMPSSQHYHQEPHMQHSPQPNIIPPVTQAAQQNVVWNQHQMPPAQPPSQPHLGSGSGSGYEMMDAKTSYVAPVAAPLVNGGEYSHHHFAVNEQYPTKYEVQSSPVPAPPQQVAYESTWVRME
jgi:hypothetical protein